MEASGSLRSESPVDRCPECAVRQQPCHNLVEEDGAITCRECGLVLMFNIPDGFFSRNSCEQHPPRISDTKLGHNNRRTLEIHPSRIHHREVYPCSRPVAKRCKTLEIEEDLPCVVSDDIKKKLFSMSNISEFDKRNMSKQTYLCALGIYEALLRQFKDDKRAYAVLRSQTTALVLVLVQLGAKEANCECNVQLKSLIDHSTVHDKAAELRRCQQMIKWVTGCIQKCEGYIGVFTETAADTEKASIQSALDTIHSALGSVTETVDFQIKTSILRTLARTRGSNDRECQDPIAPTLNSVCVMVRQAIATYYVLSRMGVFEAAADSRLLETVAATFNTNAHTVNGHIKRVTERAQHLKWTPKQLELELVPMQPLESAYLETWFYHD